MFTPIAIARSACVIRYRLDRGLGWLRFVAATADSYLYAGVIFLVVSAAFGRGGADRYFLIVLGVIGLRWTLSCLATADTLAPLTMLMAREVPAPKLLALVYLMAPPTFVFLGSLVGFAIVTQLFGSGDNSIAGVIWFPLLFVFHLSLNVAAVLAVGEAFRRGWLTSTAPVLIAATLVWFVSPVMYRFDDLDAAGVALLTTWSPGSHLIAAYHNGFWFGQSLSLEVLPAAAAGAALAAFALLLLPLRRSDRGTVADIPDSTGSLTLIVDPEAMLGAGAERNAIAAGWSVHHPLRGTPRGMTGHDWTRLVHALRHPRQGGESDDFERRIEAAASIGDLFGRAMTLYPEAAADRLACALALDRAPDRVPDRALLLVRLFDALPRDQVPERWNWLAGRCGEAGRIAVVSNRLLLPGDAAAGAFVLLQPGAPAASGAIADGLPAAYAAYLEAASHGPAAPAQSVKSS